MGTYFEVVIVTRLLCCLSCCAKIASIVSVSRKKTWLLQNLGRRKIHDALLNSLEGQ